MEKNIIIDAIVPFMVLLRDELGLNLKHELIYSIPRTRVPPSSICVKLAHTVYPWTSKYWRFTYLKNPYRKAILWSQNPSVQSLDFHADDPRQLCCFDYNEPYGHEHFAITVDKMNELISWLGAFRVARFVALSAQKSIRTSQNCIQGESIAQAQHTWLVVPKCFHLIFHENGQYSQRLKCKWWWSQIIFHFKIKDLRSRF